MPMTLSTTQQTEGKSLAVLAPAPSAAAGLSFLESQSIYEALPPE